MAEKATLMTEGPVWRHIVRFALPVFWGNLFQQLYNVVDSLVVGNFLGSDALAAVGSSGHLIFLLVGLFSGIFTGASVVISRYFGARDEKNVTVAVHTTVAFGLTAGVVITIVGTLLTPHLLMWMGTPESVLPNSIAYFRIYFSGVVFVVLYNTAAGIFQAVGDSRHPLYYLIISSITNVALDLLFVAVLGMGVEGAALATVLSQAASASMGFYRLCHATGVYRVWPKKVRFNWRMLKQVLTLGIPSGVQNSIIGIANAWSECVPGHYNLRQVAQRVKDGIYRAGGTPIEFGVIGGCDGMGQGHDGMHFIMPSRELIANSIESMAQINLFDGLVLLGSCDKIVPGMLMAAARLDIPCIFLPGGPMEGGVEFDGRQADQTSSTEAYGMLSAGKITEEEYVSLENTACPGCGSCSYLGTANTMCALAEALGMTLPDGGTAPATSSIRMMKAEETGVKIMELVEKNITSRQIITDSSIRNAIKACLAMSGSTNAVMHLTAIAYEAELGIKVLNEFDTLSDTTPQLAKMNPACKYSIVDFYKDGGVPRLMENLQSMLETDVMTVTAHTLAENIRDHKYLYPATGLVNHTLDDPFGYTGGVAVLRGNLAPDTGITKPGAFDKSLHHFKGEAICFDSEEAAEEAILAGKVHDGHVVVIRYEGPKGGPGMREMYKAMKYLYGRGLSKTTALITDGRFSGTNNGCFVGHISPEAAEGGPIAIVHDGDLVEIDVDSKKLELLVPQEEIEARLKQWKRPEPKFKKGWLGLYCKLAASGSEGGVMKFDHL